jgi:RimJ/RimL family protein N-acetyltransferase
MEKMPYRAQSEAALTTGWQAALPLLTGSNFILRELQPQDASVLFSMLSTDEVARFISPPPATVEGFERFISWSIAQRARGRHVCYGVVPAGMTNAIGLFQLRSLDPGFASCEWGFAMGSHFWGTGLFPEAARAIVNFGVDIIGVERLEARASVANGRGNGALRKIGAVQEGVLRRSFLRDGHYYDQVMWSILAEDWRLQRISLETDVH